jgi:hydrogenase maturation protease
MTVPGVRETNWVRKREATISGRTVVLGLGNPVLRDDGVGLAVAAELKRLLAEAPVRGVDVLASTRAGFELIDLLRGYTRAIIVDCIVLPNPQAGRVCRLTLEDVSGCARLVNAHEMSVGTAFRLAEQLGIPMPEQVDILAIEGGDTTTISEEMTPEVQAAVAPLAQEIYERLQREAPAIEPPDTEDFRNRRAFYSPGTE